MPKEVKWYATDHELNDFQALLDRAQWLAEQTGIDPIQPILITRMSK